MAPTIDLCPVNENGHLVYAAPLSLPIKPRGGWITVLALAALLVLAMAVILLVLINGAMVMA